MLLRFNLRQPGELLSLFDVPQKVLGAARSHALIKRRRTGGTVVL
jgi:hypothetical protein